MSNGGNANIFNDPLYNIIGSGTSGGSGSCECTLQDTYDNLNGDIILDDSGPIRFLNSLDRSTPRDILQLFTVSNETAFRVVQSDDNSGGSNISCLHDQSGGSDNFLTGKTLFGCGSSNALTGKNQFVFGSNQIVNGSDCYAFGNSNLIAADNTFVKGDGITIAGDNNEFINILGDGNTLNNIEKVHLIGDNFTVNGLDNSVILSSDDSNNSVYNYFKETTQSNHLIFNGFFDKTEVYKGGHESFLNDSFTEYTINTVRASQGENFSTPITGDFEFNVTNNTIVICDMKTEFYIVDEATGQVTNYMYMMVFTARNTAGVVTISSPTAALPYTAHAGGVGGIAELGWLLNPVQYPVGPANPAQLPASVDLNINISGTSVEPILFNENGLGNGIPLNCLVYARSHYKLTSFAF